MLNLNLLSPSELTAISTCQFDQEILAVQHDADGPKIIKISRDQVTCWQLFLRFFGLGNLASTDFHLKSVATHLNQYNWHEEIEPGSPQYNCYLKVCDIANKALLSKNIETLYINVAKESRNTEVKMQMCADHCSASLKMHWNPKLQVQHLLALIRIRYRHDTGTISGLNEQGQLLCRTTELSQEEFGQFKGLVYTNCRIAGFFTSAF